MQSHQSASGEVNDIALEVPQAADETSRESTSSNKFINWILIHVCGEPRTVQKEMMRDYAAAVKRVRLLALRNSAIVSVNRFLGFCVFTWACAVVLGGLSTELEVSIFVSVAILLLIQAIQFSAAAAWRSFLPAGRSRLTPTTQGTRLRRPTVGLARGSYFFILEMFCIFITFFGSAHFSCRSIERKASQSMYNSPPTRAEVLAYYSILTFYCLVMLNAGVATVGILYGRRHRYQIASRGLEKYYDKVVRVATENSLFLADQVDLVDSVFEMMSEEYRNREQASVVFKVYEDVVLYMYGHEKGFEAVCLAIGSDDCYVHEAAANMVGFWVECEQKDSQKRLRFEKILLRKLAKLAVGSAGPTARAAASSLKKLAEYDPHGILLGKEGENLLDILVQRVVELVDLSDHECHANHPSSSRLHESLPYIIKVLVPLLSCHPRPRPYFISKQTNQLSQQLLLAFENQHSSKRTQAVAGWALRILDSSLPSEDSVNVHLRASEGAPTHAEDIFQDEVECLHRLLGDVESLEWDTKLLLNVIPIDFKSPTLSACGWVKVKILPCIISPLFLLLVISVLFALGWFMYSYVIFYKEYHSLLKAYNAPEPQPN